MPFLKRAFISDINADCDEGERGLGHSFPLLFSSVFSDLDTSLKVLIFKHRRC
jgi:hypothetical protein